MLSELFKTDKRVAILNYVLYNEGTTITEISRKTKVSKGLVSRFMKYLEASALIEKRERKYFLVNNEIVKAIKKLLNLERINININDNSWADAIGIYGSWASGTNTSESDLDIWIKVNQYPIEYEISKFHKNLRKAAQTEVNLLILTPEKLKSIKDTDKPFYNSITRNTTILKGESFE
jgi:predicted nucleotidyltransferase